MQPYSPLDIRVFSQANASLLFETCFDNIAASLNNVLYPANVVETLPGVTQTARTIWYLRLFAMEVGGGGFVDYLGNSNISCQDIRNVKHALETIEAVDLLEMLNTGVHLANGFNPEFRNEPGIEDLCAESPRSQRWASLEAIDDHAMLLAELPLSVLVAQYILKNQHDL